MAPPTGFEREIGTWHLLSVRSEVWNREHLFKRVYYGRSQILRFSFWIFSSELRNFSAYSSGGHINLHIYIGESRKKKWGRRIEAIGSSVSALTGEAPSQTFMRKCQGNPVGGRWSSCPLLQCEQYLPTCTRDDPNRTSECAFLLSCRSQFILVASIKNLNVNSDSGSMSSCRYYMMALS